MWLLVAGCDTPAFEDRVYARIGGHTILESDLSFLRAHLRPAPPKSQSLALAIDLRAAELQATGAVGVLGGDGADSGLAPGRVGPGSQPGTAGGEPWLVRSRWFFVEGRGETLALAARGVRPWGTVGVGPARLMEASTGRLSLH